MLNSYLSSGFRLLQLRRAFFYYHNIFICLRLWRVGEIINDIFIPAMNPAGLECITPHTFFCTFVLFSCTPRPHNSAIMLLLCPKILKPDASWGGLSIRNNTVYCTPLYFIPSQMGVLYECNEGFIRRCECECKVRNTRFRAILLRRHHNGSQIFYNGST